MPIHDWNRIRAGKFHHFHNSWIYKLSDRLNDGILPPGFYAAGEQVTGQIEPDVLALEQAESNAENATGDWHDAPGVVAAVEHPPQVATTVEADEMVYLSKQDRLVVRASDDDRIVAIVEIVSQANKDSRHRCDQFLRKTASLIEARINLLVIDLHPPGNFDPAGIHQAIWAYAFGQSHEGEATPGGTLASYRAEPVPKAFVQPVNVGEKLPNMPLFLDADFYVAVPLESTYMQTWQGFPRALAGGTRSHRLTTPFRKRRHETLLHGFSHRLRRCVCHGRRT